MMIDGRRPGPGLLARTPAGTGLTPFGLLQHVVALESAVPSPGS
jgi:hypothetical protein